MTTTAWIPVVTYKIDVDREVTEPWLVALADLDDVTTHLRLVARGSWEAVAGIGNCGPDGRVGVSFPSQRLLLAECPVGALIGRIGGSSASTTTAAAAGIAGAVFPIGSHAVVKVPDDVVGPLFIGFNILLRPVRVAKLELEIAGTSIGKASVTSR